MNDELDLTQIIIAMNELLATARLHFKLAQEAEERRQAVDITLKPLISECASLLSRLSHKL